MRKINTLICMLLMLIVGNVQAQRGWELQSENATEIIADDAHYYALHRGFTAKHIIDGFLNSGTTKISANFDDSCIYRFVEVGEKETTEEVFKVYVLQNVKNNQYVCTSSTKYTPSISEAFRFTARKAIEIQKTEKKDWNIYSHAVLAPGCAGAEAAGTWIFCNPEKFQFLSFEQNHNPGFNTGYMECTNWFVFEVKPKELTPFEKFTTLYDQYISSNPLTTERYPVGTNPGCISQELYDKIAAVYKETEEATSHPDMDQATCEKYSNMILSMVDEYNKGLIKTVEGKYYLIQNCHMGFAMDNGKPYCDGNKEYPASWNVENANYIWLADSTSEEGGIFYKSITTNRYLGRKVMNSEPSAAYTIKSLHFGKFSFHDGKEFVSSSKANDANKGFFKAGSPDYTEGQWRFMEVKKNVVDSLADFIVQDQMNKHLASLVNRANNNINSLKYECSITYDGQYVPAARGLVGKFTKCNSTESREGSKEENAFDGNVNTFYHTKWSNSAPSDDWAWVELDLGAEFQEIVLKMTKRAPGSNVAPIKVAFFAPAAGEEEAAIWTDKVYEDKVVYGYPTQYADSLADSTTCISTIKFTRPVRHIRMTATMTPSNKIWGYGPTWAIGEMRVYDPATCVENQKAKLIPAEIMAALNNAIAKAQAELDNQKATQETYDELEAALDAMWEAYPDPSGLADHLANAEERIAYADETLAEMGYYRPGAKQNLQKAIDAIKNEMNSKVLTLDDIARLEGSLETAVKAFNSMLITPEPGVYRIQTASTDTNGNPDNQFGAYVSAVHADVNGDIFWRYKEDAKIDSRWNTLWKIEKNADGKFAFKNLVSGLYIENPYDGLDEEAKKEIGVTTHVHWSDTATYFSLEASPEAGKFLFTLDNNRFMNAAVYGHMAIWLNRGEPHSRYVFEKVDFGSMQSDFTVDCDENAIQIISMPIDLNFATAMSAPAYKVLGVKDNAIQIKEYGETENIPASTPFILITEKDETDFVTEPTAKSSEEWLNTVHNRKPVALNGLVSAPQAFDIEAGFGILFSNTVIVTAGGERVKAASGFFNKDLPATTEVGDLSIPLKGTIIGEGTAIENVVINNKVANDVYTISGVKVRQNVKGAAATAGLPKGIYIVGGKKVIVK